MVQGRIRVALRRLVQSALALATITAVAVAADKAKSDPRFATTIDSQIAGQPVRLVLTGTAVRTKYMLSVYTIASYLQEGVKVRDAVELVAVNAPKQLHLVFERSVAGATIAESLREAISMSHPAPAFTDELTRLDQYFRAYTAGPGDHVWLTSVPGAGLTCQFGDHPALFIENVAFARAAWEVYLGRKNLGNAIKTGLTARL